MNQFNDREQAFESKFAYDEEVKFKVDARRNKLLGLWAAELLGKQGLEAVEYAKAVIKADFEEAGDEDVYRKVKEDLDAAHVDVSEHRIRRAMEDTLVEAKRQVMEKGV